MLSVTFSVPLVQPNAGDFGSKLMGSRHEPPAASEAGPEAPEGTSGQSAAVLLSSVKLGEISGLSPEAGTGKLSDAFPVFATVTVCGLSLLIAPLAVASNVRLGGWAVVSFRIRSHGLFAM